MPMLYKSRAMLNKSQEEKQAKSTWLVTKFDTVRTKFNKRHEGKVSATSPGENVSTKKATLKSLSPFSRGKVVASKGSKWTVDTPAVTSELLVQHHEALELSSPTEPSSSDQTLNQGTSLGNSLDNSNQGPPPESPKSSERTTGLEFHSPGHGKTEVEEVVRKALTQRDLYWERILDRKTRRHDEQLRREFTYTAASRQQTAAGLFTQSEVDERVKAAIESNNLQWKNDVQREQDTAPPKLPRQQRDELVEVAVEQRNAYWECVLDKKRNEHSIQTECLQEQIGLLQDERLRQDRVHMATTKLEKASQDTRHARQLKAKDALIIGLGQIWQTRFDEQDKLVQSAEEETEVLKAVWERLQTDLAVETASAAKYKGFLNTACRIANETFARSNEEFYRREMYIAQLTERYNAKVAELEQVTGRYMIISQQHMGASAEWAKESAGRQQLAIQVAQLEEDLRQKGSAVQNVRQRLPKKTTRFPAPSGNSWGASMPRGVGAPHFDHTNAQSFGPWNDTPAASHQQTAQNSSSPVNASFQSSPEYVGSPKTQPTPLSTSEHVQPNTFGMKTGYNGLPNPAYARFMPQNVPQQPPINPPSNPHNPWSAPPAPRPQFSQPNPHPTAFPTSPDSRQNFNFNFNDSSHTQSNNPLQNSPLTPARSPIRYAGKGAADQEESPEEPGREGMEPGPGSRPKSRFTGFFKQQEQGMEGAMGGPGAGGFGGGARVGAGGPSTAFQSSANSTNV